MSLYGVVLFLHILAAVGIVGGSCAEHYVHARMRRARTVEALREWTVTARTISWLMPLFALTLLLCGIYMTFAHWSWQQPWILVSLVLLVAISAGAPLALGPTERTVGRAAAAGEPLPAIIGLLDAPLSSIAGSVFTAEALAIVLLMAAKPDLVPTLAIVVVAAAIGAVLGRPGRGRAIAVEPAVEPAASGRSR